MSNIKLRPVPRPLLAFTDQDNPDEWETLCAIVRNYAREAVLRDRAAAPHILGPLHTGMRVDYSGLLGQARRALANRGDSGLAELLRQLEGHLEELGRRWFAGDELFSEDLW